MKMVLATNNDDKVKEFKHLFGPSAITFITIKEALGEVVEAEETGTTFEENAIIKAQSVWDALTDKLPVIADDSGLEIVALGGKPGVYSKRWAGEDASGSDMCNKALAEMADVPVNERNARFVCAIAYIDSAGKVFTFTGACEGEISTQMAGTGGFGYDPIFYVGGRSYAELSMEEKNSISHRRHAADLFRKFLVKNG